VLTELTVENFALVEKTRLTFGPGLNLLTGETGAGKSILLDALGMVLGERTGSEVVRHGTDKARVEAVFTLEKPSHILREVLENAGIEPEDDLLLLSRELSSAGKSVARINGRTVTVGMLKTVGDALVDIHGQHTHQSLLIAEKHYGFLDAWCGPKVIELRQRVSEAHGVAQTAKRELVSLQNDARERVRTLDLLQFQCEEIDKFAPEEGEDDELIAERLKLSSAEKLHAAAGNAHTALSNGAIEALGTATRALENAQKWDDELGPLVETLQTALYAADDALRDVRSYRDKVEFNPERLAEIEDRLDILKTLKRKYGATLAEVLAYREEIGERKDRLEQAEERIAELEQEVEKTQKELIAHAHCLTEARKKAAKPFAEAIRRELADLAMQATRFEVGIEPTEPTSLGADAIEFLISPNPGEPLKPLAKIASGGEMSRVMLALKSVLIKSNAVPTLIFDEIDTGIGGRTGTVLGEKLHTLGGSAQVLCITHLAQIAARGDTHFFIEKHEQKGRTVVNVSVLENETRVKEIARMLGGDATETVLKHAEEMLKH
jgi:DNA repair protein RecN (Recombination protein N)